MNDTRVGQVEDITSESSVSQLIESLRVTLTQLETYYAGGSLGENTLMEITTVALRLYDFTVDGE